MEKRFLRAEDVTKELDISTAYAYKVIRQLNDELKEKGYLTISGRVNRDYFFKRMYEAGKEDN